MITSTPGFDMQCRRIGGDCSEVRHKCYGHYVTGLCGVHGSRQCCVNGTLLT